MTSRTRDSARSLALTNGDVTHKEETSASVGLRNLVNDLVDAMGTTVYLKENKACIQNTFFLC